MRSSLGKVYRKIKRRVIPRSSFASRQSASAAINPADYGQPDWAKLLEKDQRLWESTVVAAKNGPHVLIATSTGGDLPSIIVESGLAVALTLRGVRVHLLLCDEQLPACMQATVHQVSGEEYATKGPLHHLCHSCFSPAYEMYQSLGLPVHRYSDFLTNEERQLSARLAVDTSYSDIGLYCLDGLAVGEHTLAGALRFYVRGNLDSEPHAEAIVRRYFQASLLAVFMMRRLLDSNAFTGVCFNHGIYVPQGLIAEVARSREVRVINWAPAYRKKRFIFTHHETYHHALLSEPTAHWEALPWSEKLETELMDYLKSRWQGTRDWIWFHEKPQEELTSIAKELGIDFSRPSIGMLTNVMWDAQLHYRANAFPNMLDWTLHTIHYFAGRPDLQLIIRIHPAEIRGTLASRQPLLAEIRKEFPTLPKNVFVIPPESQISTYAVMLQCNTVIIYGTKTGIELASMGIPVIVAGEAWIRNKGITMDASSADEYFQMLDRLPFTARMSDDLTQRARKYAYHFFFQRMIPLKCMEPTNNWPPYRVHISGLDQLQPGYDPGLDLVCDGIMKGSEFVYPAHLYTPEDDLAS